MYLTRGQKAHVEKCHSMCKNVSPHARSMNETEIGGCLVAFSRFAAQRTVQMAIIRSLGYVSVKQ